MPFLLRWWVNAFLKGNPFVVLVTVAAAVALSVGPFYEGLKSRDPTAIGFAIFVLVGILIVVTIAIIDRKLNPVDGKKRPRSGAGRR